MGRSDHSLPPTRALLLSDARSRSLMDILLGGINITTGGLGRPVSYKYTQTNSQRVYIDEGEGGKGGTRVPPLRVAPAAGVAAIADGGGRGGRARREGEEGEGEEGIRMRMKCVLVLDMQSAQGGGHCARACVCVRVWEGGRVGGGHANRSAARRRWPRARRRCTRSRGRSPAAASPASRRC